MVIGQPSPTKVSKKCKSNFKTVEVSVLVPYNCLVDWQELMEPAAAATVSNSCLGMVT